MNAPSNRAASVRPFLAMEVFQRALGLQSEGHDVIHLEVGEPDFAPPATAVRAGIEAIEDGRTRYTHALGIQPLRESISARLSKDEGIDVDPGRIAVTTGSSGALLLALATLCDPGDEIVLSDPGYPCYPNIARALGIVPVPVPVLPSEGFTYDPDSVRRAVTRRTRAIVVNSPSNPTGTIADAGTLEALASIGPPVVSDEVYHGLVYEGEAPSALRIDENAWVVNGFSKRYAMTGWRLGFLILPAPMMRWVQAIAQNLYISAPDAAQYAALEALHADADVEVMRTEYDRRRLFLLEALPRIGLDVPARPRGAFYVFADARRHGADSLRLAREILERTHVALTPGIDFGAGGEGFLRFSYAAAMPRLEEAVERLGRYLA